MPVLLSLTLCLRETPKWVLLQTAKTHFTNSEDPDEMPQLAAFHQGQHYLLSLKGKKRSSHKNTIFF